MKKILVTGANGYLGKGVIRKLLDDGYHVIATDLCNQYVDERATFISCDIFSVENPYEYFQKPDVLLHLAWRDGFVHSSIRHVEDLPKHYKFINEFVQSGISQVAVLGSMHEVGFFEGSVNEETSTHPQSLYGIGKDALRNLVELACVGKETVFQWLRGYYIVGNTIDGCSIFSKIVQAVNRGEKEFPFTMGTNQYDFLDYGVFCQYVADTVEQVEVNGIINICSGRPEKLADRVERFIDENKFDIVLKYGAFPERPYDSKAIWGDSKKIELIENRKWGD